METEPGFRRLCRLDPGPGPSRIGPGRTRAARGGRDRSRTCADRREDWSTLIDSHLEGARGTHRGTPRAGNRCSGTC
eukprot:1353128-Rhodomonas_salina.1